MNVLYEQWTACNGTWKSSSFLVSLRESRSHKKRGCRRWLTYAQICEKYNERIAEELCLAKLNDELSRVQDIKPHPDLPHCPEMTLFRVWDSEGETDESDTIVESLFNMMDSDDFCEPSTKSKAPKKSNKKKKRKSSDDDSSESSSSADSSSDSDASESSSSSSRKKKKSKKSKKNKNKKSKKSKKEKKGKKDKKNKKRKETPEQLERRLAKEKKRAEEKAQKEKEKTENKQRKAEEKTREDAKKQKKADAMKAES